MISATTTRKSSAGRRKRPSLPFSITRLAARLAQASNPRLQQERAMNLRSFSSVTRMYRGVGCAAPAIFFWWYHVCTKSRKRNELIQPLPKVELSRHEDAQAIAARPLKPQLSTTEVESENISIIRGLVVESVCTPPNEHEDQLRQSVANVWFIAHKRHV